MSSGCFLLYTLQLVLKAIYVTAMQRCQLQIHGSPTVSVNSLHVALGDPASVNNVFVAFKCHRFLGSNVLGYYKNQKRA